MKNLKSLNQKVGIEIEETGLRPGTPGAQLAGRGPWHVGIAKFVKLRICSIGELWNFLGDSGRKLVLRKIMGTFVFGNITSPPPPPLHSRTFSGKENVFEGALLGKGAPIF